MFSAGIWPVVQRELRATARRPLSHLLRIIGGLAGIFVFCSSAWSIPESEVGPVLFHGVHRLVMALIFFVVPALTADCISRERREDTLGLLFLTPLRSWQIVVGKVFAQSLKALTLWLAIVPVLTIPFLMGGLVWTDVFNCLCQELCAGMLAVAAGIVATSIAEKRDTAFVLAYVFAAILCLVPTQQRWWRSYGVGYTTASYTIARTRFAFPVSGSATPVLIYPANSPPGQIVTFSVGPPLYRSVTSVVAKSPKISLSDLAECFLVALLILWAAIRFAGRCVDNSWKDRLPSARRENWVKRYCSPIGKEAFARSMSKALEWNPVFWLQQYSWKARVTTWTLCLGFVALGCCVTNGASSRMIGQWEWKLMIVLAAVYTYAGVNGFYQEKKNGALELLLVTPVSVDELIFGRVYGLWKRFFPTVLIMALWCIMTEETAYSSGYYWGQDRLFTGSLDMGPLQLNWADAKCALLVGYFTLPIFATFCALRVSNIVTATACTWLLLLAGPFFGVALVASLGPAARGNPMLVYTGIILGNGVFVWFTLKALRDNLARRIYNF